MTVAPGRDPRSPLVFFDLDDTLSDRAAAFRNWAEQFVVRHEVTEQGAVEWMCEVDDGGYQPRDMFFMQVNDRFGLGRHVGDLVDDYLRTAHLNYRRDPELIARLDQLVALGIRVGVITNGGAGQDQKIDALGIRPALSACVVSGTVGVRKPDAGIFRIAIGRGRWRGRSDTMDGGRSPDQRRPRWRPAPAVQRSGSRTVAPGPLASRRRR